MVATKMAWNFIIFIITRQNFALVHGNCGEKCRSAFSGRLLMKTILSCMGGK
jgi:hypothetical protein